MFVDVQVLCGCRKFESGFFLCKGVGVELKCGCYGSICGKEVVFGYERYDFFLGCDFVL